MPINLLAYALYGDEVLFFFFYTTSRDKCMTRHLRGLLLENIEAKSKFVAKFFCSFFGVWGVWLAGYCTIDYLLEFKRVKPDD